jgi:hypothetical protein
LTFRETTWRYIPEDSTLHNHYCENLKSYIFFQALENMASILNAVIWPSTLHRKEGFKGLKCGEVFDHPSEYSVLTLGGGEGDIFWLPQALRPLPPLTISFSIRTLVHGNNES